MEEAARQFARRVLMVHLALLLGVVAIVFFASREIYTQTKRQTTEQAQSRQALLAAQTARGIEAFYHSIFNDLDLLRQADRDEGDETERPATTQPAATGLDWQRLFRLEDRAFAPVSGGRVPGPGGKVAEAVQSMFSGILWKQLDGRVSMLFAVSKFALGDNWSNRGRFPSIQRIGQSEPHLTVDEVIAQSREWLRTVDMKPQISPFQQYTVQGGPPVGMNLVCVPVSERTSRLLVAAVPIRIAQSQFMDKLNSDADSTNAVLCDESGTIMAGSKPELIGRDVNSLRDDRLRELARSYVGQGKSKVEQITTNYTIAGHEFPPAMVAIEPVRIAGKKWTFIVTTPLADVDAVVSRVFERAVFWAIFVVFSMTGILVSTSVQLIRARARMERVRAEALTKEMTQAREIQLAWLPRQGVSVPKLDLAAVNQPTNHISGDFYNWFELPDGRMVVTIGDVTGHGLSAAFLMATTQLLVHTTMLRLADPGKTLDEVNRQLCTQVFNGQFVTMLVLVLDLENGRLEIAAAGHYPPVLGYNGHFEPLPAESQLVLGVDADARYPTEVFDILPGTTLVLYTDGVIDAHSPDGARFGLAGILDSVRGRSESAQSLVDSVVGRINHFRGTRELPDDLTLVCIQTQPTSAMRSAEPISI